jgi:octaprenyl-diphosphate synthase
MGIGTAFQLVDDMLDLSQDEETLGKPSCGDIVEGKMTLPILYLREALDAESQARLDAMPGNEITNDDRAWVRHSLTETGALSRTEALAKRYISNALIALNTLPESAYRDSMAGLAEFVVDREF